MRNALVIAAVAALVGCGTSAGAPAGPAAPATKLTIQFWADGDGTARKWTLTCNPAGGTLPRAATACSKLAGMRAPFAPIPADAMCTQQFGGPEVAVVSGTYRGRRVWAKLQNRNGCEIARFKSLAFLFPGYGSGSPA